MKILHTSDWHLGRTLHRADLTPAFELWAQHVISLVRERDIDAVLISGDVYDRAVPPVTMVNLLSRTLAQLAEHTCVILISGNHDSAQRLGFTAELLRPGLHIRTDPRQAGEPVEVRSGNECALVYPIPYLDPDVERHRLAYVRPEAESRADAENETPEPLPRSHEAVMRAALELVRRSIAREEQQSAAPARIVMAHEFVTGASPSDSERDISVGGVGEIPAALFTLGATEGPGPVDYVALGHLHSPQQVAKNQPVPPMRYSGSPIAFSFSESAPKSSVLLTFTWPDTNAAADAAADTDTDTDADANVVRGGRRPHLEVELIPAPVWRPIVTIQDSFENILGDAYRADRDKFARIEVTDASRPAEMNARILQAFPHALEVQHRRQETAAVPVNTDVKREDPLKVLEEFMVSSGGRELNNAEQKILRQAVEATRKKAE
ncbi:putative exonuclease SbcD [Actinobaculum suis]|uniref:Nuclease SbcCD subunit D n=1 Tax=Actinobaculum suis TaxID=1657 RepID=A0A7Z8YA15_9ACTO|nr:exonuclease SbcCD subunit D [Actinobaculum suis]VDG77089.1 putative exonuclease SbcD [Actinobaculum suis]